MSEVIDGTRRASVARRRLWAVLVSLALAAVWIVATPQPAAAWTNNWSIVPGGWETGSGPAVVNGTGEIFVRGLDNRIWHNKRTGSSSWQGWIEVPGGGRTLDAPAAVTTPAGLVLVVRGTDHLVHYNFRNNSGAWRGWAPVCNSGCMTTYSAPAITYNSYWKGPEVFARGPGDKIYHSLSPNSPTNWGGWTEVNGRGVTPSGPAVVQGGGQIRVFVRGAAGDNRVWYNWKNESGSFRTAGYEAINNGWTSDSPAAASDASGNIYVAVRGTNDRVYAFRGYWHEVGYGVTHSQPAIGYTPFGLCVFVRGTPNNLVYFNCQ